MLVSAVWHLAPYRVSWTRLRLVVVVVAAEIPASREDGAAPRLPIRLRQWPVLVRSLLHHPRPRSHAHSALSLPL